MSKTHLTGCAVIMKAFKKSRNSSKISRDEALRCRPIKAPMVNESRLETGDVLLMYTVVARPWFSKFVKRFGGAVDGAIPKKLQLDALGTEVWDLVDGRRTVRQIIQRFAEEHRLHSREAEVSVTQFLRELGKRGLIGLQ